MTEEIIYRSQSTSFTEILKHLELVDRTFVPPLSDRVNIREYSRKISDKAVTFEAWYHHELIGLLAAYKSIDVMFITNLSVFAQFTGKGIGLKLLISCIDFCKESKIGKISLEVSSANHRAKKFYLSHGFYQKSNTESNFLLNKDIL